MCLVSIDVASEGQFIGVWAGNAVLFCDNRSVPVLTAGYVRAGGFQVGFDGCPPTGVSDTRYVTMADLSRLMFD
jgi:hypothetical protein